MKKLTTIILATVAFVASAFAGTTPYPGVVWNQSGTNFNVAVGPTGTNSSGVYTNNALTGVVLGATTNFFNLSGSAQLPATSQPNTNLWPSASWSLLTTYPNTYAAASANLQFYFQLPLTATNATSTAVVLRFAGSVDGSLWVSNYFNYTYTIPVNTLNAGGVLTNINTGALPFIALQAIENPGVAAITNAVVEASQKPTL